MRRMWLKVLREVIILYLCLAIFPVAEILFVIYNDSLSAGMAVVSRGLLFWEAASQAGLSAALLLRLFAPYLIVQAIRGYWWSRRSLVGKKWANLYYAVLLVSIAGWAFWRAWDLFYFMYALGDIPAELPQFFEMEWSGVLILVTASLLAVRCFLVFIDPVGRPPTGGPRSAPSS